MKNKHNVKTTAKRILSIMLTMLILLSVFPSGVHAVNDKKNPDYQDGKTLRPVADGFRLDKVLEWKKGDSPDEQLNRGSVPLRERFTGHVVNPKANPNAKIQSVPLMNSKNRADNSVNGNEFDSYAFNYWQYVDQIVFWDGPIPTPDIIDSAHRNGVPVYGNIFFNWSTGETLANDQRILKAFLTQKTVGTETTYPVADKLIEIAEYYGFDGYFINQETPLRGYGDEMRDFMLYAKRRAKQKGGKIRFAWYDAMANSGSRSHKNAVDSDNDYFVRRYGDDKVFAADEFFVNFNWYSNLVDRTVNHMKSVDRDPFDAYAGFELQQNSLNTSIRWDDLLDEDGKLKVSIGLYTPDSIRGLARTPEDYHEQERNFWVGFDGDPVTSGDSNSKGKSWRGLSRFVADKSTILSLPFNSYFNTGHGKKWFINGTLSKDEGWNSRGIQDVLPTWRWWIRKNGEKDGALEAKYDFNDAYNSGNSVRFHGSVNKDDENKIMLYSTKLNIVDGTKVRVTYKGGKDSNAFVELGTSSYYSEKEFHSYPLPQAAEGQWRTEDIDISNLSGQTVYSIGLKLTATENNADYAFLLGQIALYADAAAPQKVQEVAVDEVIFRTSKHAEVRLSWVPVADAEYYEVHQETADGGMSIVNATSSSYFYGEDIRRDFSKNNNTQKLYVIAVGKNGMKSEPAEVVLDWRMDVEDTENFVTESRNLCLDASVTGVSSENSSEPARNAINGTISNNTDKWCTTRNSGWMTIAFPEAKEVKRIAIYHAGSGGEAGEGDVNNMNTPHFAIEYKRGNDWVVAYEESNNRKNITDIDLQVPVLAKEWRLNIKEADRSPWKAVRIYEWQMFDQPKNKKSAHIPMRWVTVNNTSEDFYNVVVKNVPRNVEVKLYRDSELTDLIEKKTATGLQFSDVSFTDVRLEIPAGQKYGKFYYVTKDPAMELDSIRMTAIFGKQTRVNAVELVKEPVKKIYKYGAALDVTGGRVKLSYENGTHEVVKLTPDMVSGFQADQEGDQELTVSHLGVQAAEKFTVTVKSQDYLMKAVELKVKRMPKSYYTVGEELNLEDGSLEVVYEDLSSRAVPMTNSSVTVEGFDSAEEGSKRLTITYLGLTVNIDVAVNAKPLINKEKLEETIRQVETLMEEEYFEKADKEEKDKLVAAFEAAKKIFNESQDENEVATAVGNLLDAKTAFLAKAIKQVSISEEPTKTEYQFGEEISLDGGMLKVVFASEEETTVAMSEAETNYNPQKAGEQNVTVTYKGFEAGTFKVMVIAQETETMKHLKEEVKKAKEIKETATYTNAPKAAQEALDNIIKTAEMLIEQNGRDEDAERVIKEIREAIADLSAPAAPLLPYIPEVKEEEEVVKKEKEVVITDEKIALSVADKALVTEMTKEMSVKEDKDLVEKLVAKQIFPDEFVKQISPVALQEFAKNVKEVFVDENDQKWYAKELSAVRMIDFVKGYEDKTFKANNNVTGEEFVTMLVRAMNLSVEESKGENWFAPYKKVAEESSLLKGITFDLKKGLTRQEVAALAYSFMKGRLSDSEKVEVKNEFGDKDKIAAEYVEAVNYLAKEEILKGYTDGTFMPANEVSRAEVVVILYRLLKK